MDYRQIKRAVLSVTDKTGLVEFAKVLAAAGTELVSTGGTARTLRSAGLNVRDISDLTGFPEILDGRVKTLHPKVHGGILHIRDNEEHRATVAEKGIEPIDMVVVNLYAFEKAAEKAGIAFGELIENIDIGGPSMVRSAAKNFEDVAVVTLPHNYEAIAAEMKANGGSLCRQTRWQLARTAFAVTAAYDSTIAETLAKIDVAPPSGGPLQLTGEAADDFPAYLRLSYPKIVNLRYGENPHQRAALYGDRSGTGIAGARQLQGKELSYNNLVDLDACWELVQEFDQPAVAIVKHSNPCGAALGRSIADAFIKALASDPVSAYGGVVGVNRELDEAAAGEIAGLFVEAIAAPSFSEGAIARLSSKKNLRLLAVRQMQPKRSIRQISGGILLQDSDTGIETEMEWKTVTEREPSPEEWQALRFAWRVAKHVKSNAIVYARENQTVGVGAGQMSRVDAAKFGAMKAVLPLAHSVAASDAFFPFPDGLETVAAAGATAVIQPGGSVRDGEVIQAANRLGLTMVFTGRRHFRH